LNWEISAKPLDMRFRKIIQRRIRRSADGVDLVGDLNAAIAANVGERSQTTHVSSRSTAVTTQDTRAGTADEDRKENDA
jgi:hypothetical protein